MLAIAYLLALITLANVVWAPTEARRIRDGQNARSWFFFWPRKSVSALPREEFLARYRAALKRQGSPWAVLGAVMLTFNYVLLGWRADAWSWAYAGFFLLNGLAALRCRRIIDSAPASAAPRPER